MKKMNYALKVLAVLTAVFGISAHNAMADQITIDLPRVNVTVTKDADGFAKFAGEGIQYLSQPGEPAIPYLVVKALLPPGADLSTLQVNVERAAVTSAAVQSTEAWEIRPMPVPQVNADLPALNSSGENEAVYNTSIRFPYSIVGSISTGAFWEWQLADIPVALYHWNPVTKGLFTLESSQAVLTFEHKSVYGRRTAQTFSGMGKDRVKNMVVNFDQMAAEYPTAPTRRSSIQEKSSYVIITTNAIRSASAQMANFVQHKENRGYAVRVFTENIWGGGTGDTAAENIRNWLIANYEVMNIEYVLLIGNPNPATGDVPMKMLWPRNNATVYTQYKDSPSDFYYADLTGNWDLDGDGRFGEGDNDFGPGGVDRISEVIVGRIPYYGNAADLDSILAKTIAYQNETNQEWRKKVLLPMEPSNGDTINGAPAPRTHGYELGEAIKNNILVPKGWNYHRLYDNINGYDNSTIPIPADTESVPCNINNVTTTWNASDYGAVFWWTHGSSIGAADIMDLSHAAMLDNAHPAFTFQCSCTNSHPETTTNLSYSLLKNGAIATVGATRVSWYAPGQTDFSGRTTNSSMTYEYAKRIISDGMKGGYALHNMKQELIPQGMELWMNFTDFCLYGDPEVGMMESNVIDNPPTISDIPDQTTQRDIEITVSFSIGDDITPVTDLKLSVTSSNPALVPIENLVFGGSGEERTVTVSPVQSQKGSSAITIIVTDEANNMNYESFLLSVSEFNEWEWQIPKPQGNALSDIWGTSENNVYAVGAGGTILHYDGNDLTVVRKGTFDGILNSRGGSSGFYDIWGTSESDIFAVGGGGIILHYNGTDWKEMDSGVFNDIWSIWGTSSTDIFAVGEGGTFIHYDGSKWEEMMVAPGLEVSSLWSVYGFASDDVYAVQPAPRIVYHYDGIQWTEMASGVFTTQINAIWGTSSNDIYVAGWGNVYHYNGVGWSEMTTEVGGWNIWGTASDDIYIVYNDIYHFDGNNGCVPPFTQSINLKELSQIDL